MSNTNNDFVKYEHPLNEKIRIFLRMEYLWQELEKCLQMESDISCMYGLNFLLQLLEINDRFDLKSDAIKYTDKLIVKFHKLRNNPDADVEKIDEIITILKNSLVRMKSVVGKLSAGIGSNEWLSTIRQKVLLPGGTCPSDLPFLYYWQKFPLTLKVNQILEWREVFHPLVDSIKKVLFYTRQTSKVYEVSALNGNYQKMIDNQYEPQIIIVEVPAKLNIYPEISGNRYRIAIRFLQTDLESKATLFTEKVDFKLSVCW